MGLEAREHTQMRIRQIGHMHVITNAGSIGRWVIIAKDGQRRAAAKRRVNRKRHQMGFGVVIFPRAAGRV